MIYNNKLATWHWFGDRHDDHTYHMKMNNYHEWILSNLYESRWMKREIFTTHFPLSIANLWRNNLNLQNKILMSFGYESVLFETRKMVLIIYTREQRKRNTKIYINISRIYWIYFHWGFLVISWIQKTEIILTLLVLTWNVRIFIRMRTFEPSLNWHFQNQHLQA